MTGIGDVAAGISLAKEAHSLYVYFRKKGLKFFTKESLPLDWFRNQEITIICSSLYAPLQKPESNYYSLYKFGYSEEPVPVGS